ncbi:MAG: DUF2064 domain-containing protein [Saprospiraceae bacterium]
MQTNLPRLTLINAGSVSELLKLYLHSGFESYLGALIMMERKPNIAILYFSLSAEAEAYNKSWFSKNRFENNRHLASTLISDTYLSLKKSGLDIFHFHEGNQKGNSFGEKLANAYDDLFKKGFDAVIAVGNDAPELAKTDWNQVVEELEAGNSVLGPTYRQGAYLIGLTKDHFQKDLFQQLPWQTRSLLDALLAFSKKSGEKVLLLQRLRDVNTLFDVYKISESTFLSQTLLLLLKVLLFKKTPTPLPKTSILFSSIQYASPGLRAPPIQFA